MVVVTLVYVYILDILFCMDVSVSILIEKYCIKASFFFFFFLLDDSLMLQPKQMCP